MARRCRCQYSGEYGNTDVFYKVVEGGKNKYYKSKEVYEQYIKEKEDRKNLLAYISDKILDYQHGQPLPPILLKRIKELNKFYDYEVILETFKKESDTLKYWMSLDNKFKNEFGRIQYMMAIINNSIIDVDRDIRYKRKQETKKDNTREDIVDIDFDNTSESNDLSDFLD